MARSASTRSGLNADAGAIARRSRRHGLRVVWAAWVAARGFSTIDFSLRQGIRRELLGRSARAWKHTAVMLSRSGTKPPGVVRWHGRGQVEEVSSRL